MEDIDYLASSLRNLAAYEASKYRTSVTFGKVIDISSDGAVTVELLNGFVIGGSRLVLSMFCKERIIKIPYDEASKDDKDTASHIHDEDEMLEDFSIAYTPGQGSSLMINNQPVASPLTKLVKLRHKHKIHAALPEIKLWRGLKKGDYVVLSEMGNGLYYVHERASLEEGNSNEILNPKEEGLKDSKG